jgi:chromate reductase
MNVAIISGSARDNNNTIRLGKAIQRFHSNDAVNLVDFRQYDIPLINQGPIELNHPGPFQSALMQAMLDADIIYIITPEYNWSTTPEILNWLHRYGESPLKHLFDEKVFALAGVSTGKGGKAPVLHLTGILNKIISYFDLNSFVSPRIFESHYTKLALDAEGLSTGNEEFEKGLASFVAYTTRMVLRWKK